MKSFFADTVELRRSCVVRDFQGGGGGVVASKTKWLQKEQEFPVRQTRF